MNPENFSNVEHKMLFCLGQVKGDSLWGTAVRLVMDNNPTEEKVKALISQLKSQSIDNPPLMLEILDQECFATLQLC
jgi:hypothetical protein